MKKIKLFTALLITFSCVLPIFMFAGCSGGKSADITPLLGTWTRNKTDMEITYVLKSDNTYTQHTETTSGMNISMDEEGTFTYDGKTLTLITDYDYEYAYDVSFSGNTMYWDNGSVTLEYTKK